MKCSACQQSVGNNDRFCSHCGARLQNFEPLLKDVRRLFQQGDYRKAQEKLDKMLDDDARNPEVLAWKGHACFFSQQEDEALKLYSSAREIQPERWDICYQTASLHFAYGRYPEAVADFEKTLALKIDLKGNPLSELFGGDLQRMLANTWLYLGLARKEIGLTDKARKALEKAISLDDSNPLPYGVLGDLYSSEGNFEQSAQAYSGALEKVTDEASLLALHNDLGVACFRAGQYEKAAEEFKWVIHRDPQNSNAVYNLGVLYLKQGMQDEMRDDLREFMRSADAEHILMSLTRSMVDAAKHEIHEMERAGMIGSSPAIREVLEMVRRAAVSDATVLILGENGTGKELAARAIHLNSPRRKEAFIAVNCGALPENLLESELFGYEKGAFTGAVSGKPGRFELAEEGTLFLDEIGDLNPALQVKLLRVIQDRTYERLGGTKTLKADVRIIAATHQDLRQKMLDGSFREDLFYRLYVVPITIPPLRLRKNDIPSLIRYFMDRFAKKNAKRFIRVDDAVFERLSQYSWPGNIRELENVIERAVAIYDDEVLRMEYLVFGNPDSGSASNLPSDTEKEQLIHEIRQYSGNLENLLNKLNMSRATLFRKLKYYGLSLKSIKKVSP